MRSLSTAAIILWLCTSPSAAQNIQDHLQRAIFEQAEATLLASKAPLGKAVHNSLANYPLYPYLLYREMTIGLPQRLPDTASVIQFLRQYADSPVSDQLRQDLLPALAAKRHWQALTEVYRAGMGTEFECWYRQALLHTDRAAEALHELEAIWLNGHSQPSSCDPLFHRWKALGQQTSERVWKRFKLAIAAGNTGMARYLRTLLGSGDQRRADTWLAIVANPQQALNSSLPASTPETDELIRYAIKHWSSRDSVAAAPVWDQLKARYKIAAGAQRDAIDRRLALFVAARGHASAAERLRALPKTAVDEDVEAWRVRVALSRGDWAGVEQAITSMRAETANKAQWRYWLARALYIQGDRQRAHACIVTLPLNGIITGFWPSIGWDNRLARSRITPHCTIRLSSSLQFWPTWNPTSGWPERESCGV